MRSLSIIMHRPQTHPVKLPGNHPFVLSLYLFQFVRGYRLRTRTSHVAAARMFSILRQNRFPALGTEIRRWQSVCCGHFPARVRTQLLETRSSVYAFWAPVALDLCPAPQDLVRVSAVLVKSNFRRLLCASYFCSVCSTFLILSIAHEKHKHLSVQSLRPVSSGFRFLKCIHKSSQDFLIYGRHPRPVPVKFVWVDSQSLVENGWCGHRFIRCFTRKKGRRAMSKSWWKTPTTN